MTFAELRNTVEIKERDALKVVLWSEKDRIKFNITNVNHLDGGNSTVYLIPEEGGKLSIPIKEFENQVLDANAEIEFANSLEDAIKNNGMPLTAAIYTKKYDNGSIEGALAFHLVQI